MRALSASEIMRIWEVGQGQGTLDQALTVLTIAGSEQTWDDLAMLGIGERDARLFAVRERTFGSQLNGVFDCPSCANQLEIAMETGKLCAPGGPVDLSAPFSFRLGDYMVRFRLPNSFDLASVAGVSDEKTVSHDLLQRCIEGAWRGDTEVNFEHLPAAVLDALIDQMCQADPRMEIEISFCCPACGNTWRALFDIASFLWNEFCACARRLFREVHTLATAYGWREADILALSPERRQFYLEMVGV